MTIISFSSLLQAEWIDIQPIRKPPRSGFFGDVQSHITSSQVSQYGSMHECGHLISSLYRNKRPGWNAFYILNNKIAYIKQPQLTISQIDSNIKHKGGVYQLYIHQSGRNWNSEPLYILEENHQYIIGTLQYYEEGRQTDTIHSHKCALELTYYSLVMQRMANECGNYDAKFLNEFIDFQLRRLYFTSLELKKRGWYTQEHYQWEQIIKENRLKKGN